MQPAVSRAVAVAVALVVTACTDTAEPGELGAPCASSDDCVDGLGCKRDACLGDALVTGQVLAPLRGADQSLRVALFRDGDEGAGVPLIPSRALLERSFAAPVSYPVRFEFSGVPAGEFVIVAFVVLPDDRVARGQVDVSIDLEGALLVNGLPDVSIAISLTGESPIEE